MAKIFGLNGLMTGKMGNTVFVVTNGIQVARQYNPVVANPKSSLQMLQRAKGNLCGRISSFVPRAAISGLGINNRARRAEFQRILLKNAVSAFVDNEYVAKVADDDVVFSRGTAPVSVFNPTITAASYYVNVALYGVGTTEIQEDIYATLQTRLVAMVYDATTEELVQVVTRIANKPNQGASVVTYMPVVYEKGYKVVVYAIPMSTADGSAVSVDSSIAAKDDNDIAAALSVNRSAVVFEYGKSYVLGQSTYTPQP